MHYTTEVTVTFITDTHIDLDVGYLCNGDKLVNKNWIINITSNNKNGLFSPAGRFTYEKQKTIQHTLMKNETPINMGDKFELTTFL